MASYMGELKALDVSSTVLPGASRDSTRMNRNLRERSRFPANLRLWRDPTLTSSTVGNPRQPPQGKVAAPCALFVAGEPLCRATMVRPIVAGPLQIRRCALAARQRIESAVQSELTAGARERGWGPRMSRGHLLGETKT